MRITTVVVTGPPPTATAIAAAALSLLEWVAIAMRLMALTALPPYPNRWEGVRLFERAVRVDAGPVLARWRCPLFEMVTVVRARVVTAALLLWLSVTASAQP